MNMQLKRLTLALAGVALVTLAGCGGSGNGGGGVVADATTADVVTRVVDGPIENALVCLDKDGDGLCGAGEPSGRTDANGNLTLKVDKADIGKYALVTEVRTDAIDAENGGAVTLPFSMSAPPGKPAVISPLTTMVHQAMQSSGATEAEAEALVKEQTGVVVNLFEDFTTATSKAASKAAGGTDPGKVARMIVITTQEQNKVVSASLGAQALDGSTINAVDLKKAVQKKLIQILPTIVSELNAAEADPANDTQKKKEAALLGKISTSLMTAAAVKTEVAVINQVAKVEAPTAPIATGSLSLLTYTNATNWNRRMFTSTAAQNTPDANNNYRFEDRHLRSSNGTLAVWGFGGNPGDQANLHFNGTTWAPCGLNFEGLSSVRDALGNSTFNYCDNFSNGKSSRALFDISGKSMMEVYQQTIDAGYTNLNIANAATVLGSAIFPPESKIGYNQSTDAFRSYVYALGSNSWVLTSNQSTGGDAQNGNNSTVCSATNTTAWTASLEEMAATFRGTPCKYNVDTSILNLPSNVPNEVWGNTVVNIGTVSSTFTTTLAPVVSNPTSHYTGNLRIMAAFTSGGPNEVTYYLCKQRQVNGFTRNCTLTGEKTTYNIVTLADGARVLKFATPPASAANLTYSRVFVERAGKVFYGYVDKLGVRNEARLNLPAANALFTQLGINNLVDPDVRPALTRASYQGTWDWRGVATLFPAGVTTVGTRMQIGQDGVFTCFDNTNGLAPSDNCGPTSFAFDPVTGAINGTQTNGNNYSATMNFITGQTSGTRNGPADLPPVSNVPIIGQRR